VARVLGGLKVFEYIGSGGSHVGRSKIDPALITGARKGLARILVDAKVIRPENARQVGYPHFTPDPDAGHEKHGHHKTDTGKDNLLGTHSGL